MGLSYEKSLSSLGNYVTTVTAAAWVVPHTQLSACGLCDPHSGMWVLLESGFTSEETVISEI